MSVDQLVGFALAAVALTVLPGPSVLFVVSRVLSEGPRAGFATVAGTEAGVFLQGVCVAVGLGELVQESIVAHTVVKAVGAGYLVYLGARAIRDRARLADGLRDGLQRNSKRLAGSGFIVGATNPKGFLLFAAILPQFVDAQRGHATEQMIVLAAVAAAIAFATDSCWALLAGRASRWLTASPRRAEQIGAASGAVMVGLGVGVAAGGRHN